VGEVRNVRPHPRGMRIWLADVALGAGAHTIQIVFGGDRKLLGGELVPVAPPGSRAIGLRPDLTQLRKKMRVRRYRGERSHGMLCSLDELGWLRGGPNEVAVLCEVKPGESLDDLPRHRWPEVVEDWERAALAAKLTRTALTDMFDPAAEAAYI
jgi:tRNA-binding EMAP/Myf-like protein